MSRYTRYTMPVTVRSAKKEGPKTFPKLLLLAVFTQQSNIYIYIYIYKCYALIYMFMYFYNATSFVNIWYTPK
jgi:hypothetical protein